MSALEKVKVLFIAGRGRSGSTLLDRVLGQIDGLISAGELRYVWERGFQDNQLCGCGQPFWDCPHWRDVVRLAGIECDPQKIAAVISGARVTDRIRRIPGLMLPGAAAAETDAGRCYRDFLGRIYSAIQRSSGCNFIVDSSKTPSYGFVLNTIDRIDLYVLQIVRDSRAVAYSWQRKRRRPEIHGRDVFMPVFSPAYSAKAWMLDNLLAELLARKAGHRFRLRYEDFVARPQVSVDKITDWLGLDTVPAVFSDDNTIHLEASHTVSGNPMRFKTGALEVKSDDSWQVKLNRRAHRVTTMLTWPLLLTYGYLNHRRRGAYGSDE